MIKFKNMKLGNKILTGFTMVLVLMVITVFFGYLGFNNNIRQIRQFDNIANHNLIASKIQAELLNSRFQFKNYISTANKQYKVGFDAYFDNIDILINEAKDIIDNAERLEKIQAIEKHTDEYRSGVEKVVALNDERNYILNNILNVKGSKMQQELSRVSELAYRSQNSTLSYNASETLKYFMLARVHAAKYLESLNGDQVVEFNKNMLEADKWLSSLEKVSSEYEIKQVLSDIKEEKKIYTEQFIKFVSIIEEREKIEANLDKIGPKISTLAEEIKQSITKEQNTFAPKMQRANRDYLIIMSAILLISLASSIVIAILIKNVVMHPVSTITSTFKDIAKESVDLNVRINADSSDEMGELGTQFNNFMDKLQIIMLDKERQSWLTNGQAELNNQLRGEQDVVTLSSKVITYVCKRLNAQTGAIYISGENDAFHMTSSYAYTRRKNICNKVKIGEGVLGQAILEKKPIIISEAPEEYMIVSSALGEAIPRNIMVIPCVFNNEVKAVIEIGTFQKFEDVHLNFIEVISESIAIFLNSAESRDKMKLLLEKTIQQSEELQAQQEELRQNNEELEEQTKYLRESESILQAQQEELKVTNEELEERTKLLEKQKQEVYAKSNSLEKAKEQLEKKAKELQLANKYKSEFLANMSHELRTPLNSILILSQILSEKKDMEPLTPKQIEFAKTIHSSGTDLLSLINDILDLSKVEAGKMDIYFENVPIAEIVERMERSFRPIAQNKNLDFSIEIQKNVPESIYTDPQRIQQVIRNLLSNAFKFTANGDVRMDIKYPDKDTVFMNKRLLMQNTIEISVSDTGIGIPKDKQEIIFEAFQQCDGTTSRKYGGTGLGLSISRELIKVLGGEIHLKSIESKGSTFTIYIPIDSEYNNAQGETLKVKDNVIKPKEISPTKKIVETLNKTAKKTILIIEDNIDFSDVLADLSKQRGFECMVARSGEEGLALAIDNNPSAILLDITLPGISGLEVIERLKENPKTENIPVHIMSALDYADNKIHGGIIGYLKKPVSIEQIESALKKIEIFVNKEYKNLLIVEGDKVEQNHIKNAICKEDIKVTIASSGIEAYSYLKNNSFDCMILGMNLEDTPTFELLRKLKEEHLIDIPIIIYTTQELLYEQENKFEEYAGNVIIKGPKAMERLIGETTLFLHSIDKNIEEFSAPIAKEKIEIGDTLKGKTILVVDDDMRNVFALTNVLEQNGIKVIPGRNGREGLEKLAKHPEVNLVIMDVMMPEMDGYEAMRSIRANSKFSKLPIIALTAKAMKEDRKKCIDAGANDYMIKPIDSEKLISLLRVWLYQ